MQFEDDQRKPAEKRQWLAFEVDTEGKQVFLVLATQKMLLDAWRFGHKGPLYMDATHGIQRYGLKVVTLHVKTNEHKGERRCMLSSARVPC